MRTERRKEVRVRQHCNVELLVGGGESIEALLYNVSRSGVAVDVQQWIEVGAYVRISGEGFAVEGTVRYCEPCLYGYRVGVA